MKCFLSVGKKKEQYYSNYKSIISNTAYHFDASRDLGEVITSIITSCIFSGIGDCHGIMNFCCACLFMENKCNFHMKKKKEDSVAILNALLQKHALSYSKWLLELHS